MRFGLISLLISCSLSLPAVAAPSDRATPSVDASADRVEANADRRSPSGLPVPRFVSLKKDKVRARFGPSFDYPVAYEFNARGLPLKVISEDNDNIWRRVEDRDGRRMWIHRSMLSPINHAIVTESDAVLRAGPSARASGRARLSNGVMARIETCKDGWCRLSTGDFRGWVEARQLWGTPK